MANGTNGISKKYIKRLKRALKKRRAYDVGIIRDVNEMFENTASEGKSAEELILRLGSPEDFAAKFDRTERPYAGVAAFTVAAVSLLAGIMFIAAYAVGKLRGVPEDAIGYAESATEIFVTGGRRNGGLADIGYGIGADFADLGVDHKKNHREKEEKWIKRNLFYWLSR